MPNHLTLKEAPGVPGVDRRAFCACALALGATAACGGGGGSTNNSSGGGGGSGTTLVTTTDTKGVLLAQPAGTIRDYTSGPNSCPESLGTKQGVYLVRDATGIYAISASCLHLGGRIQPAGGGFSCFCHGSQYNLGGTVTVGPAPVGSELNHYEVRESSPGAVLVIDLTKTVAASVRLS
jgi:Rieske Fe-S protein